MWRSDSGAGHNHRVCFYEQQPPWLDTVPSSHPSHIDPSCVARVQSNSITHSLTHSPAPTVRIRCLRVLGSRFALPQDNTTLIASTRLAQRVLESYCCLCRLPVFSLSASPAHTHTLATWLTHNRSFLGGVLSGLFTTPARFCKGYEWENYWFVYSIFGLVVVPWGFALLSTDDVYVLAHTPLIDFVHVSWSSPHPLMSNALAHVHSPQLLCACTHVLSRLNVSTNIHTCTRIHLSHARAIANGLESQLKCTQLTCERTCAPVNCR